MNGEDLLKTVSECVCKCSPFRGSLLYRLYLGYFIYLELCALFYKNIEIPQIVLMALVNITSLNICDQLAFDYWLIIFIKIYPRDKYYS